MAKRRRRSSKLKWCRVGKTGKVVARHRKKSAAKKARRKGQSVRKC